MDCWGNGRYGEFGNGTFYDTGDDGSASRSESREPMPVPLPSTSETDLAPTGWEETAATAYGIASAVSPVDGLIDLQRILLESVIGAMTGHAVS